MVHGPDEGIAGIRRRLAGAAGAERIALLIEAARRYLERYQHLGQVAAELDEVVVLLREAYRLLGPRDLWRAQVGQVLGASLMTRYLTASRAAADRDDAVTYFEAALEHPDLPADAFELTLLHLGMLRLLRSMPEEDELPTSAVLPGGPAVDMAALLGATTSPARLAELDAAVAVLQRLTARDVVNEEVRRVADLMLAQATMLRGLLGGDFGAVAANLAATGPLWTEGLRFPVGPRPGLAGLDSVRTLLGPASSGLPRPAASTTARSRDGTDGTGPALRTLAVDLLVELRPGGADGPGRLVTTAPDGTVTELAAPGLRRYPDGALAAWLRNGEGGVDATALDAVCDWAGTVVVAPLLHHLGRRPAPSRVVLVAPGPLAAVPWHAARLDGDPGRRACADLAISYADGAARLVEAATRPPLPVTRAPVFLVHPGDADATMLTMALRRLVYHRSVGLGGTGEQVDGPATADALRGNLSASLLQLHCPAGDGTLTLAAPDGRSTPVPVDVLLPARRRDDPGGLVVLPAATGSTALADAFLAAGAAEVVDTQWPVPPKLLAPVLFMFHHFLVERSRPAGLALTELYRWAVNPGRKPPPGMPAHLSRAATAPAVAEPAVWAAFRHRGR